MHFIVTSVFWPLVFPTANRNHGSYDIIYFMFSHGLTLFFLLIEAFFSQIEFNRKIIPLQSLYIAIYAVFGICIFETTGYAVYDFMDVRVKKNRIIAASLIPVGILFNEIIVCIGKLKDAVLF